MFIADELVSAFLLVGIRHQMDRELIENLLFLDSGQTQRFRHAVE